MTELELGGVPLGKSVNGLNVDLPKFTCKRCQMDCFDVYGCITLTAEATQFIIQDVNGQFALMLPWFVRTHPDLETLVLQSLSMDIISFRLPLHEKLTILQLVRTTKVASWAYNVLNVSSLVNLQKFVLGSFTFGDMVVDKSFSISNLHKLISLDFTDVAISRLNGSLGNVLVGCDSLVSLRLKRSNFWSTIDRLSVLLRPASATLEVLDISGNAIDHLPQDLFAGMYKLRRLDLSDNAMTVLNGCVFSQNSVLSTISLTSNHLSGVVVDTTACLQRLEYLRVLELRNNMLACTCDNRQLRNWIRQTTTKVRSISHDELCPSTEKSTGVAFSNYTLPWIACDFHKEEIISVAAVIALGLLVLAMYGVHYYRYDIWFWWRVKRRHRQNRQHRIHPERKFHAFLSYTSSEQLIAEYMFEELEGGQDVRFKIAYDCRDFLPLYDITDNIIRCIDASEKVIFLISRRFLEREWCQFEMNFAQMRCFDERKNLIILVFVEKFKPSELPKRLRILRRQVNYMDYPDHADRRAVQNFWHRLRLALAQDTQVEMDEPATTQTDDDDVPLLAPQPAPADNSDEDLVD